MPRPRACRRRQPPSDLLSLRQPCGSPPACRTGRCLFFASLFPPPAALRRKTRRPAVQRGFRYASIGCWVALFPRRGASRSARIDAEGLCVSSPHPSRPLAVPPSPQGEGGAMVCCRVTFNRPCRLLLPVSGGAEPRPYIRLSFPPHINCPCLFIATWLRAAVGVTGPGALRSV